MTEPKLDLAGLKAALEGGRRLVLLSTSESPRHVSEYDFLSALIEAAEERDRLRNDMEEIADSRTIHSAEWRRQIPEFARLALERKP